MWQDALTCLEATAIREYSGSCQCNIHMNARTKVSQQNIPQSITLPPPACHLPVVLVPSLPLVSDTRAPICPHHVKENNLQVQAT